MKPRILVVTLRLETDLPLADFRSQPIMQKLFAAAWWNGKAPRVIDVAAVREADPNKPQYGPRGEDC